MAACGCKDAPAARSEHLLSSPDAESAFVLSVSDTPCELLAGAIDDDLIRAGEPWPLTEELRSGHPADLETFEAYFDRRRPRHGPDAE